MVHIIWEFRVREGREREFELAYGSDGVWARLFAGSPAYRGTVLLRDGEDRRRFLTIDRWDSAEDFARFRETVRERYDAIDRDCEILTESEKRLGTFEPR